MFNRKTEEQQWSRFRGALARDRDEVAAQAATAPNQPELAGASSSAPPVSAPGATSGGGSPALTVTPSFRPAHGDASASTPTRPSRPAQSFSDGEVESVVGERTSVDGTLKATGAIRVLGTVNGEIESKGSVYIDERAQVTAKVTAAQVIVAGRVDGQIFCEGKVEIRPTGRVSGEVQAGSFIIQEGAFFEGSSKMAAGKGSGALS